MAAKGGYIDGRFSGPIIINIKPSKRSKNFKAPEPLVLLTTLMAHWLSDVIVNLYKQSDIKIDV